MQSLPWLATSDILLFIDDDFYLDPQYLKITERFFVENPEVVASTGRVLADDVKGPGLSVEQAKSIVAGSNGAQCEQQDHPYLPGLRMQYVPPPGYHPRT